MKCVFYPQSCFAAPRPLGYTANPHIRFNPSFQNANQIKHTSIPNKFINTHFWRPAEFSISPVSVGTRHVCAETQLGLGKWKGGRCHKKNTPAGTQMTALRVFTYLYVLVYLYIYLTLKPTLFHTKYFFSIFCTPKTSWLNTLSKWQTTYFVLTI